ncbi:MAG: hypothetical protein A2Y61_01725 [Chloroflexi bacterium RBG_13_60_13]|nr:MAG: hypothetical protein A2Y61_01725 [Chloroflexi bacterium RBG_13_60_13]
MRILSVELTNFGTFYETHQFGLADRGLLLVMGDNQDEPRMESNGAGKSTVFDALDWCLFGENPRGDHADAMVNEESRAVRGSKCSVTTRLESDSGEAVEITRSRSKSKYDLEVAVNGEARATLDSKETQKVVEQILGLDREVFHAAVLFGQTDLVHYAEATDAKRMEILTRLLQLDEIDRYLERVKERRKVITDRRAVLEVNLATVGGQLQANRPEDLDVQIEQWEANRVAEIGRVRQRIEAKAAEHAAASAASLPIDPLRSARMVLDQRLAGQGAHPGIFPEVERLQKFVAEITAERAVAARGIHDAQARLRKIQAQGEGVCSQCGQAVTGEHLQNEALKARGDLQTAEEAQRDAQGRLDQAEALSQAAIAQGQEVARVWQAGRESIMAEIAQVDAQIRSATEQATRVRSVERELAGLQGDLDRQDGAANPWQAKKDHVARERYDLERRQGQIRYEMEAFDVDARHLDFWVVGLGPKGLKSYILDSRLQELSDAANEWMQVLTGGTIWVQFEATKETRGKKVVNAPDVRVSRWNPDGTITERPYRSWSGGEKQRISFAIDFGLSRLVARRAAQRYDLMILDEAFRHLDRAGKEAVMEMLQTLSREKSSLIVVEHDSEFQGQFEHRVLVTKRNRRSTIREVVDETGEASKGVPSDLPADPPGKRPRRQPVRRSAD